MKFNFDLQINTEVESITLGMYSQACSKYPKQQVYNVFATSQGKRER